MKRFPQVKTMEIIISLKKSRKVIQTFVGQFGAPFDSPQLEDPLFSSATERHVTGSRLNRYLTLITIACREMENRQAEKTSLFNNS